MASWDKENTCRKNINPKQIDSICQCLCTLRIHQGCQNLVRTSVKLGITGEECTTLLLQPPCITHTLTSRIHGIVPFWCDRLMEIFSRVIAWNIKVDFTAFVARPSCSQAFTQMWKPADSLCDLPWDRQAQFENTTGCTWWYVNTLRAVEWLWSANSM